MNDLRVTITERLASLRREAALGAERLQYLQSEEAALRETLLRIAGATQVLTELLDECPPDVDADVFAMATAAAPTQVG